MRWFSKCCFVTKKLLLKNESIKYTAVYLGVMTTTIKIHEETKSDLDEFREHPSEPYDTVIKKIIYIAKNAARKPKLSKDAVLAIEAARERAKRGDYLSEEQVRKRLGL